MFGFWKKKASKNNPIQFSVGINGDKVVVNFGRPVEWIAFTAQEAAQMANLLISKTSLIMQKKTKVIPPAAEGQKS